METEEFKERYAERYKIETKNSELKSNFEYDRANVCRKIEICETLSNSVDEKYAQIIKKY